MLKGITMLAAASAMLTSGIFSGVMTSTVYANDRRLPARFMATHRVNMYNQPGGTLNGGWFDHTSPGEQRVISWGPVVNGREYWQIEYNLFAGGTRRGWARRSDLIQGRTNNEVFQVTLPRDTQVFERPDLARSYGTVWGGNRARDMGYNYSVVLNRQGNSVQIVYRLANGGGRIGWIRLSDMQGAARSGNTAWFDNMGSGGVAPPPTTNNRFVSPISDYRITQEFGVWNNSRGMHHAARDMVSRSGNRNVLAAGRGTVVGARQTGGANQGVVVIRHPLASGYIYSFYAHLGRINVSVGNSVNTGTVIGQYSSHLHFTFVSSNPSSVGHDLWGYGSRVNNARVDRNGFVFLCPRDIFANRRLR